MDDNPYLATAQRLFGQIDPARAALSNAAGLDPDQEANYRYMADRLGVPVETIRSNPAAAKTEHRRLENTQAAEALRAKRFREGLDRDFPNPAPGGAAARARRFRESLNRDYPDAKLSRWLAETSHAAIAQDDVPLLTRIGDALTGFLATGPTGAVLGWNRPRYTPEQSLQMVRELRQDVSLAKTGSAFLSARDRMGMSYGNFAQAVGSWVSDDNWLVRHGRERQQYWFDRYIDDHPIMRTPTGRGFVGGIESLGPAALALLVTRGTGSALAGTGTLGALTYGDSYVGAREDGLSHGWAVAKALIDSTIEMGTEIGPQRVLGDAMAGKGTVRSFLLDLLRKEIPGEQLATLGQDFAQWSLIDANKGKAFGDYVAEIYPHFVETLAATVTTSGAIAMPALVLRAADRVSGRAARAEQAQAARDAFADLGTLAVASKLRERAPADFQELLGHMAEDGPVTDLYVAPDRLFEAFAQSEITPEQQAALSPRFVEATEQGTDVRIPVEDFATHIAGTPAGEALLDHVKASPTAMSRAEAEEFMTTRGEALQQEVAAALDQSERDEPWRQSVDQVRQEVLGQLEGVKRYTKAVNQRYADLHAAFYAAMAARLKTTPKELFDRFPVRVEQDVNTQAQTFTQPEREMLARATPTRTASTFRQARDHARTFRGQPLTNEATGIVATLGRNSLDKMLSASAAQLSTSAADHSLAVANADSLFANAVLDRTDPDRDGEATIKGVHRFYAPLVTERGVLAVKMTVKETTAPGNLNPLYTIETMEVEPDRWASPDGEIERDTDQDRPSRRPGPGSDVGSLLGAIKALYEKDQSLKQSEVDGSIWFSALEKAVEASKQAKASPEQWLATLSKSPGVKKEELDWTGLPDWLKAQDGAVTRDELLAFVREGGVRVEEVMLGGEDDFFDANEAYAVEEVVTYDEDGNETQSWQVVDRNTGAVFYETDDSDDADDWINAETLSAEPRDGTKFPTWTESGGEDYRELLLTLPNINGPATHWDQPNVVAHLRFKTREDTDGKRVLFLEEVQSDWHQMGRDQGYAHAPDPEAVAAAQADWSAAYATYRNTGEELVALAERVGALTPGVGPGGVDRHLNAGYALTDSKVTDPAIRAERDEILRRREAARLRLNEAHQAVENAKGPGGIPDAPFKSTWPALAMRRAIRYAVDNGFEQIAWIRGDQQNGGNSEADGAWFYDRNLVNITNDIVKKYGTKVRTIAVEGMTEVSDPIFTAEEKAELNHIDVQLAAWRSETAADYERFAAERGFQKYDGQDQTTVRAEFLAQPSVAARQAEFDAMRARWDELTTLGAERAKEQGLRNPGFDITPELKAIARQGFSLFQSNRGAYTPATDTITLLQTADLSTFLHESAHFFLEMLDRLATDPGADQSLRDMFDAVLQHFGVSRDEWRTMTLDQKRPHHEDFAESFERYLYAGHAPSLKLRDLFRTFRAWLTSVYRRAMDFLTAKEVSPSIREVFDRMLATDAEIAEAEAAQHLAPLFGNRKDAQADENIWREYQRAAADSTNQATEDLQARALRDMRWLDAAKGREVDRLKRRAADTRKVVRAEVAGEVQSEPVYRAQQFLKRGVIDGQDFDGPHRLYIPEVDALYGDNPAVGAIKAKLGYGAYGMLSDKEGIHPEQAAEMFGFTSADHLIRSLIEAEPMQERIDGLTEQRLLEEHTDLFDDAAVQEAANRAVMNEARTRAVALELAMLDRAVGKPKLLTVAARQAADAVIDRKRVRDLRPALFEAASVRAADAAMKAIAKGDQPTAAAEKRNQLFAIYAAKAARRAQEDVTKALAYFDRVQRSTTIDADEREQIADLLAAVDLRRSTTLTSIDEGQTLSDWIKAQQDAGFDPIVTEEQAALLRARKSYKQLSVEELRGLVAAIKNIEHLGRQKHRLLTAKKDSEVAVAVEQIAGSISTNAVSTRAKKLERDGYVDAVKSAGAAFFAWHRKFSSLARQFDGFRDGGPTWEYFIRPMNAAGDREATMREAADKAIATILKPVLTGPTAKLYIPEIGDSLSLQGRIAAALNMGNADNLQRLGWTEGQRQAVAVTLTADQWRVVQNVWDYLDSYWPEIAAKERRVTGVAPEKVEAQPLRVATADGQTLDLAGGYYPIKYDANESPAAEQHDAAEAARASLLGAFTRATTRRGHTKARVNTVRDRPLRFDLGVIAQHLNQVIHDLSWHEYLIDANRLLRAPAVDGAIRDHYGPETVRAIKKTLEDVAAGDLPAGDIGERIIRHVRSGASIAAMGWSVTTAAVQITGFSQSIARVGARWVGGGLAKVYGNPAQTAARLRWAREQSRFMAERGRTQQREINEVVNRIRGKNGVIDKVRGSFFWFTTKVQLMVDLPTWYAGYDKALASGQDHETAVALADQAVLDSQGGGQIKDLAEVQRGHGKGGEFLKLFTNFYSYMNLVENLMAEEVGRLRLEGAKRTPMFALNMALYSVVPTTLSWLLLAALRGDDLDDPEEVAKAVAKENVAFLFGLFVGVREFGAIVRSDGRYSGPAGNVIFDRSGELYQQIEQGKADEALLSALNDVAGVLFHLPSTQVGRSAKGVNAIAAGEAGPQAALFGEPRSYAPEGEDEEAYNMFADAEEE